MCGIGGCISLPHRAIHNVVKMIELLSYRGYDSKGLSYIKNNQIITHKQVGKESFNLKILPTKLAIGHTRWGTHGEVNLYNCHPHFSEDKNISIVHNGIIENYMELKFDLSKFYKFNSNTDSEVIVHLLSYYLNYEKKSLDESLSLLFQKLEGSFAVALLIDNKLIGFKRGSPLVLGIGENELFISSDPMSFVESTNQVIYLSDDSYCILSESNGEISYIIKNHISQKIEIEIQKLNISIPSDKGQYENYMQKEIFEQSTVIQNLLNKEINVEPFRNADKVILIGCGSSYYSCQLGKLFLENLSNLDVRVEYASDFCFQRFHHTPKTLIVAVSQSGETFDVLEAIKECKKSGLKIYSICNIFYSSLYRESDYFLHMELGYEIGVCSTKTFLGMVVSFLKISLSLSNDSGNLESLPNLIEHLFLQDQNIYSIAQKYYKSPNILYLGRGYGMPLAQEGALKMKEISYIHAEAIHASELKHGNIALIDKDMCCIIIGGKCDENVYSRIVSNISEIKCRKGKIISIITEEDSLIKKFSDDCIILPNECTSEILAICSVIPIQLLAYHFARLRGCDTDKPRNLAKSCTTA
jgi:glucosamine--fructose-6-phosphate aminotransferase (isomerizing)